MDPTTEPRNLQDRHLAYCNEFLKTHGIFFHVITPIMCSIFAVSNLKTAQVEHFETQYKEVADVSAALSQQKKEHTETVR